MRRLADEWRGGVVLGGYQLAGHAMEPRIDATVGDLHERIHRRLVAPGHCTGWRAPSVVGSRYRLDADRKQ